MRIDQFISGQAVSCLADGLLLVGPTGFILDANAAALSNYDRSLDQMCSLHFHDLAAPPAAEGVGRHPLPAREDGLPYETLHRRGDGTLFPVEVCSATVSADGEPAVLYSVRDITQRKKQEAARDTMLTAMVNVIGSISETRDPYTAGHERRVSELATEIAIEMGLPGDDVADIRLTGLIHDIGKVAVPAEILSVAGQLSSIEFEIVKDHSQAGYDILTSAGMDDRIAELVHQHHERCDGSGYPRALHGDELLVGAKILMVADVVEAMSSPRPHRPALGVGPALAEIVDGAGKRYDTEVAAICVRLFRERGFAFSEA